MACGRARAPCPAPRRHLLAAAVAAAAVVVAVPAEGVRTGVPEPSGPVWDVDIAKLRFDKSGFILPNGSHVDMDIDDSGNFVLPNGAKVEPWNGLTPESFLTNEAFVCHGGKLFGVRLPGLREPGKPPKRSAFIYVQQSHLPSLDPIQVYADPADGRKQFLLFPPIDSETWRMLYRRASSLRSDTVWLEQRLFQLGKGHPCQTAEEAQRERELEAARRRVLERKKRIGDIVRKAAARRGRAVNITDEEAIKTARRAAMSARARNAGKGPIASIVLRSLIEENWHPAAWQGELN